MALIRRGYKDMQEVLDSMSLYHNYVGLDDDTSTSPPTKGLAQFFQEIGIRKDDFVVMKMDVEGVEFDLIERMLSDGSYKLVDEVRYTHMTMARFSTHRSFLCLCILTTRILNFHTALRRGPLHASGNVPLGMGQ